MRRHSSRANARAEQAGPGPSPQATDDVSLCRGVAESSCAEICRACLCLSCVLFTWSIALFLPELSNSWLNFVGVAEDFDHADDHSRLNNAPRWRNDTDRSCNLRCFRAGWSSVYFQPLDRWDGSEYVPEGGEGGWRPGIGWSKDLGHGWPFLRQGTQGSPSLRTLLENRLCFTPPITGPAPELTLKETEVAALSPQLSLEEEAMQVMERVGVPSWERNLVWQAHLRLWGSPSTERREGKANIRRRAPTFFMAEQGVPFDHRVLRQACALPPPSCPIPQGACSWPASKTGSILRLAVLQTYP